MMVRKLERGAMKITPDMIMMEGETVLTQYIIPYWNLDYVNKSNIFDHPYSNLDSNLSFINPFLDKNK